MSKPIGMADRQQAVLQLLWLTVKGQVISRQPCRLTPKMSDNRLAAAMKWVWNEIGSASLVCRTGSNHADPNPSAYQHPQGCYDLRGMPAELNALSLICFR
jgi:hypothetical protein